ncbi:hypothetical protein [Spiroplasma ixodetis]|uniref:hypothetical protein n=1 Tax=Spiroplasma ixodetis TaxID=2141 RepID=UPI002576F9C3|nr:hypothetical protein [Spiroplasma ixodetis]WJG70698.1 hypothetical protein SIXOD_v1c19130 [Spiroplasma ixodetis Y32]
MKNNLIVNIKKRNKVLNTFLNGFTTKIVNDYLHFLENNKNDIPEIILDYLDQSIFLMRKKININKLKEKINIMEKNKSDIIDDFLIKNPNYKDLCNRLSFVLNVITIEKLQEKLFYQLCTEFWEYKIKLIKKIEKNKNIIKIENNFTEKIWNIFNKNNLLYNYNFKQKVTN